MANRDTRTLIAHLFRRAGFGLRPDELDHFTALGVQGSVAYLIDYESVVDPAETQFPLPNLSRYAESLLPKARHTTAELKANGALRAQAKATIQEWWVERMLATARPLQEKMTLFWHGHFATGISKARAPFMLEQNQTFRSMALGTFDSLLRAVNADPAMLLWLDGAHNRAGKPNENFSRELMELFTLGLGAFTERDVQEGARALTGWTIDRRGYLSNSPTANARLVPRFHDAGTKTYLGHTGTLGSDDVMNILAAHPATGHFIARKLFAFFAHDAPDDATLKPLVDTYYSSRYGIKAMVRQLLLSDAFYSDQAFQGHIKSPVEFVIGSVRELDARVPAPSMVRALALMGQDLFNPANVGGWPGGRSWINASTLVERFNFAGALTGQLRGPMGETAQGVDLRQLVARSGAHSGGDLITYLLTRFVGVGATPATVAALTEYLGPSLSAQAVETRLRGLIQLVLSTPEYQLN